MDTATEDFLLKKTAVCKPTNELSAFCSLSPSMLKKQNQLKFNILSSTTYSFFALTQIATQQDAPKTQHRQRSEDPPNCKRLCRFSKLFYLKKFLFLRIIRIYELLQHQKEKMALVPRATHSAAL